MKPERIEEIEKFAELISRPTGAHIKQTQQWCIEAASALRELLDERKWKPIDSAPMDGTWFWAFYPKQTDLCFPDQWKVARWLGQDSYGDWIGFIDAADNEEFNQPTHWLPLPSPPEEGEGK